jgi:hypothetical protein
LTDLLFKIFDNSNRISRVDNLVLWEGSLNVVHIIIFLCTRLKFKNGSACFGDQCSLFSHFVELFLEKRGFSLKETNLAKLYHFCKIKNWNKKTTGLVISFYNCQLTIIYNHLENQNLISHLSSDFRHSQINYIKYLRPFADAYNSGFHDLDSVHVSIQVEIPKKNLWKFVITFPFLGWIF